MNIIYSLHTHTHTQKQTHNIYKTGVAGDIQLHYSVFSRGKG